MKRKQGAVILAACSLLPADQRWRWRESNPRPKSSTGDLLQA